MACRSPCARRAPSLVVTDQCSPVTRSGALGRTRTNQCPVHKALPGPARGTTLVAGSGGEWPLLAAAATGRRTPTPVSVQAVLESKATENCSPVQADRTTGAVQTPAPTAHAQLTIGRHAAAVRPGGCCTTQRADRLQARPCPGSRSDLSSTPLQSRSVMLTSREVRRMLQACQNLPPASNRFPILSFYPSQLLL